MACIVALECSADRSWSHVDCSRTVRAAVSYLEAFVDSAVVEWDKVHSGDMRLLLHRKSVRLSLHSRASAAASLEESAGSLDVRRRRKVPFRRNLRMLEGWKRPSLDRSRLLRTAMQ